MKELKSIEPMSLGRMLAVIYAVIGFIAGLISAAFTPFMAMVNPVGAAAFGLLAIIIFPILFAVIGFVMGIIVAFVYNVVAKRYGGIKLDL
ncbi:MAG: hypothetical protein NTY20_00340 [Candidatus Aenigmarchaeota archaeon]|nr:hypothetical protein [Candidatus Aenigmarchaeota archaeon]